MTDHDDPTPYQGVAEMAGEPAPLLEPWELRQASEEHPMREPGLLESSARAEAAIADKRAEFYEMAREAGPLPFSMMAVSGTDRSWAVPANYDVDDEQ